MVDHPLEPDELTAAGLPSARRGFDRKAVIALLDEASRRWKELRDHHDSVIDEIERRGGVENLGRDLREIGERVANILGEAQQAAEGLRAHAVEEAQVRIDGALEYAGLVTDEADRAAFGLRKDAWETGSDLLHDVQATIEAMIEQAEADTLIIRAQAEQEAHRHLADSRKEATDIIRGARFEAERLMGEAKRRADELLAGLAHAEAAAAEGRSVRSADWGVTVIDTEGVRLGRDPAVEIDPHHPAYGDVLAAEVGSLRRVAPAVPPPPPDPPATAEPSPSIPESESESDPDLVLADTDSPAPEEADRPDPVADEAADEEEAPDEVGGLFDRLRNTDENPVVVPEVEPEVVARPDLEPEPEPEPLVGGPDAIEVRERVMLPLINEYVRTARQVLMDIQNVALDEIRTLRRGTLWEPDLGLIRDGLRVVVLPLAAAAVEAGGREIERWVRTAGFAGYHDGLVAGLTGSGIGEVVGIRHGRLCADCPAAAGIVWDPAGAPPDGYRSPPVHLDCTCAVEVHI